MPNQPQNRSTTGVILRDAREADLPTLFQFQLDPDANRMAAFTAKDPNDRDAYMTKWTRLLADPTIVTQTILLDGVIVGSIGSFTPTWGVPGRREVTYWIAREHWSKGIATAALRLFLRDPRNQSRPIHASAAKDNIASMRVLENCGFRMTGSDKSFANARGEEIEEAFFILE